MKKLLNRSSPVSNTLRGKGQRGKGQVLNCELAPRFIHIRPSD